MREFTLLYFNAENELRQISYKSENKISATNYGWDFCKKCSFRYYMVQEVI